VASVPSTETNLQAPISFSATLPSRDCAESWETHVRSETNTQTFFIGAKHIARGLLSGVEQAIIQATGPI
jgi:hypothetical protein